MKKFCSLTIGVLVLFLGQLSALQVFANVPGGGTGTGPNVTLTDNGSTVTIADGIVSILCTKSGATINQINYTFNNNGSSQTINLLSGGNNGGQLYWENSSSQGLTFTYSLIANPAANGGNYAEIAMTTTSISNDVLEVHFSMLRGSTGFYVSAIWYHRGIDGAFGMGECRDNIYAGTIFNWMSVDANRNRLMETQGGSGSVSKLGAPAEVSLWTNGIYAGQYEDKYKYSADFGTERVWGWSSVGTGGKNVGLWNIIASAEYYNGGPMKRELMSHIGTTILNMLNGGHYGGGSDGNWSAGEVWTKVTGPYFIYCNNVTNTITGTNAAAQALYSDAQAQAAAEATAWPYSWFTNANYTPATGRGTLTGQIVINDVYNPDASASNLWVGVVQQPITTTSTYDFQEWMKPYQFWVQTDSNGNFTIPNVIAGNNYTLYAYGPGAAGTFQSQIQTGGSAPNTLDIPSSPFSLMVTAGVTNDLGMVTWTPTRVGPTVFEIGYPDRTSRKFRHGDDWWVGDIGPGATNPLPVWSKFLEYPFDFPSGPNYIVGQSRWTTDWNFAQPVVTDNAGNYNGSTSTIKFNLPAANSGSASLYIALSSDYQGPLIVQVNGNSIAGSSGYFPAYSSSGDQSDASIREGIHGMYSDNRINFSGNLLVQGQNTITINMRKGGYFANHAMYDYIRLEQSGYVPPAPANVAAYAGNNCNLLSWPVQPGATSYNIYGTTTSGSGYSLIASGVTGPVCGSGFNNATYLDTNAVNDTTYYYVVQSVNTVGTSANSSESSSATPDPGISTTAPAAPAGVTVTGIAHQSVTLSWSAVTDANFYTIYRSTLFNNGGGASNVLGTIVLNNATTGTSYTDTSPTDGTIYSYFVTATSAGGTSGNSPTAVGVPLPAPPASAPATFTGSYSLATSNVTLNWSPVAGAIGYIIRQGTSSNGTFNLVETVTETNYTDTAVNPGNYYYRVQAVNAAGVSTNKMITIVAPPFPPASLTAVPGDSQIVLTWTPSANTTGYYLYRGTSSGGENVAVVANYAGTSYTNTGLVNGTTYYYYVTATNAGGISAHSAEASATPNTGIVVSGRSLVWKGDGSANVWDTSGAANWLSNSTVTVFNAGDNVTFDNTGSNNAPIALTGALLPSLVTFNATKNYTFGGSGSIAGTNILVKANTGTLTISTTNTYSGGTIISNGSIVIGNIGANSAAWGSGPIYFYGGTVQFNGYGGSLSTGWGGCTNPMVVPLGQTGTLQLPPRWGYSSPFTSPLTGSGTLNVTVDNIRDYFSGDWSDFDGNIVASPRSGTGDFRIDNTKGYAGASIYLNNGANLYTINNNNLTVDIGELGGGSTAFIGSGSASATNPTWRIGAKNTTNTYAGTIADAGVTALIKIGTGTLILTGATNTYSGGTTVNGGALIVNNTSGSGAGTSAMAVNSSGTLGGTGIISAPVTVNNGGNFAPGNPLGTLTINNNLTLAGGSATWMQVQHTPLTNNAAIVSSTVNFGGTLNVTNIDTLASGDTFKLFTAGTYSGAFTNLVLPPLGSGLYWNTSALMSSGTLSVATMPSPMIASVQLSSANAVISGSNGTPNWTYYVLATTNVTLPTAQWTPIATNQFDASGNFILTNPIDPTQSQTFYILQMQ